MECNKDEATRAKEIAEKKFALKDLIAARKFALKAQNLYPGLEGISQMLSTLEVYTAAENKVNGDPDWYAILKVEPNADDEMVRKQYRKLALMLHPDKNKSIGADGAFKLISEAWSLLSDKNKRAAYDVKRKVKTFQKPPTATTTGGTPSVSTPGTNGFYNFNKPSAKTHKSTPRTNHSSGHATTFKSKPNTFWTVCQRCKMQYEYLRVYLNHNLLCPNCREPFLAVETAPPPASSAKSAWIYEQNQKDSVQRQNHHKSGGNSMRRNAACSSPNVGPGGLGTAPSDSHTQTNFQWGPFSGAGGTSTAAQAASVVQQAYEKVKRERGEAEAFNKREEALRRKHYANASKRASNAFPPGHPSSAKRRKGVEEVGASHYGNNATTNQVGAANQPTFNFQTVRVNGITKPNSAKEVPQPTIHTLLMEKARAEVGEKLKEWKSGSFAKNAAKEEKPKEPIPKQNNEAAGDQNKTSELVDLKTGDGCDEASHKRSHAIDNTESVEALSINVPDPDFHDFDKDRTETSFGDNQVWAAYDDDDGMPRYYAMIHNVISLNPFKMRISWLNSRTNNELGPLNWVGSGFAKTCGDFRVGRHEVSSSLNSFSHKVNWIKGLRGSIRIFPKKGDVWALYRNWSPDWNELTADDVIHKYDMVEVLEDFSEEENVVTVAPLVKVAGFKTVFHRHLDPKEVRRIPKEELFRFSHHVPSYLLTGQEAPNAPKGCRELDPAATPLELLQVITDVKDVEMTENERKEEETKEEEKESGNAGKDSEVGKDVCKDDKETEITKDIEGTEKGGKMEHSVEEMVS